MKNFNNKLLLIISWGIIFAYQGAFAQGWVEGRRFTVRMNGIKQNGGIEWSEEIAGSGKKGLGFMVGSTSKDYLSGYKMLLRESGRLGIGTHDPTRKIDLQEKIIVD